MRVRAMGWREKVKFRISVAQGVQPVPTSERELACGWEQSGASSLGT